MFLKNILLQAFDQIKRTDPDALKKVFILEGNCALKNLGLSYEDQRTIVEEVNVIFHCAATTKPDETIRKAVFTNIRATKDLIELAKKIPKLKVKM